MLKLHPEILKKDGQNEFVVLPYEEFVILQEMLDDAQDVLELRRAKADEQEAPTIGVDDLKIELGLDEAPAASD